MGRRSCETEASARPEPPRKRTRTASNNHSLNASVNIEQPLPPGQILTDVAQKQWKIGKPIGCGSFGEIYLASDDVSKEVTPDSARYVLKIEPHSNGPLFVELHCLIRIARHHTIFKWQREKKLKSIGIPHFIANGSHILDGTRYRFLVLPRYNTDLHKLARTVNYGRIHPRNVLVLAVQIIDVLEYLHAKGYTHSDIKSSNLMIGFDGTKFRTHQMGRYQPNRAPIEKASSVSSSETPVKKNTHSSRLTYSGYYEDEDFVVKRISDSSSYEDSEDDGISRGSRPANKMKRNKKFNLRKPKTISYVDDQSSMVSDDSYQRFVKTKEKWEMSSSDEGYHEGGRSKTCSESNDDPEIDYFEEAILSQTPGQIYLLDYGLASKFVNSDGTHKEFGMDQRKAHDGTLEYSSRDSHIGAHSRRSDLENLGYNIIDWLTGSLPWKNSEIMENPDLVHAVKKNYMNDVKKFLETCFKTPNYPKFLEKYFEYITQLEFSQKPDYTYCKSLFVNEFVDCGFGTDTELLKLNFECDTRTSEIKKKNYSKKVGVSRGNKNTSPEFLRRAGITKPSGRENFIMNTWENSLKMDLIREGLNLSNDGNRKPCACRNFYVSDAVLIQKLRQSLLPTLETPSKKFSPKVLRSKKVTNKKKKSTRNKRSNIGKFGNFMGSGKQYTWAEILAGNPEDIIRKMDKDKTCQNDNSNDAKNSSNKKPRSRKVSNASEISVSEVNASPNLLRKDYLCDRNPTYAMKEVVANYRRKICGKALAEDEDELNESGYTYAMIRVIRNKEKREKKERLLEEKEKKSLKIDETKGSRNVNRKVVTSKQTRVKNNRQAKVVISEDVQDQTDAPAPSTAVKTKRGHPASAVSDVKKCTVSVRKCNIRSMPSSSVKVKGAPAAARGAGRAQQTKQTTVQKKEMKKDLEKRTTGVEKVVEKKEAPKKSCLKTSKETVPPACSAIATGKGKQKTVSRPSRTIATRSKMLIRRK